MAHPGAGSAANSGKRTPCRGALPPGLPPRVPRGARAGSGGPQGALARGGPPLSGWTLAATCPATWAPGLRGVPGDPVSARRIGTPSPRSAPWLCPLRVSCVSAGVPAGLRAGLRQVPAWRPASGSSTFGTAIGAPLHVHFPPRTTLGFAGPHKQPHLHLCGKGSRTFRRLFLASNPRSPGPPGARNRTDPWGSRDYSSSRCAHPLSGTGRSLLVLLLS